MFNYDFFFFILKKIYPPEVYSGLEWQTVRPHEEAHSALSSSIVPDYKFYNKYDVKKTNDVLLNRNLRRHRKKTYNVALLLNVWPRLVFSRAVNVFIVNENFQIFFWKYE